MAFVPFAKWVIGTFVLGKILNGVYDEYAEEKKKWSTRDHTCERKGVNRQGIEVVANDNRVELYYEIVDEPFQPRYRHYVLKFQPSDTVVEFNDLVSSPTAPSFSILSSSSLMPSEEKTGGEGYVVRCCRR
jgi:hypothetical protein